MRPAGAGRGRGTGNRRAHRTHPAGPPDARYPDAGSRGRFYQGLYERLAARPELDGVMLRASLAAITEESGEIADRRAASDGGIGRDQRLADRRRGGGERAARQSTDRTILLLLLGQGGRQLGIGAIIALPLTLLVGWGFSRYFPIALSVSVGTALGGSAAITALVLAATWLPTRRAIAIEPRDALWRE